MKDTISVYLFNDKVYYCIEELNEAITEVIYELYPEIIHSDFEPEDSFEFEDLCEEVEEIELSIEKLKENIGGDYYERTIGNA